MVGTNDGGYVQNFGHDNTVHSNLLAFGDRREVRLGISDPLITKLDFNNNLLLPKSIMPFDFFATSPDVIYANNRVSNRVLSTPADLTKCGGGCTVSTVVLTVGADPRIITLTGADIATATWVAEVGAAVGPPGLAASVIPAVKANLPPAIVAPPVGFEAALAETAVGGRPFNLKYVTGGSATAIAVQADAGTPTGKSLIFTDSAAIVNRWEPYAWATLSHTGGISTVEFSIKIDANTHFMHEWRDNANSYLAGPSMRIKPTGIEVAGRIVASAPVGEWINLKITAPLDAAAGRWTLEVRYSSGAVATVSNLANINAGWKRLNWLGFVSNSGVASTAKIGFIKANTSLGG